MTIVSLTSLTRVYKDRKRVARGYGSGYGTTGGRGIKGQKSRSGVSRNNLYSVTGQNPIYRSLPKRGFSSHKQRFGEPVSIVSVGKIAELISRGVLSDNIKKIDLVSAGILTRSSTKIKLLGDGDCNSIFTIEVDFVSSGAMAKINSSKGSVVLVPSVVESVLVESN